MLYQYHQQLQQQQFCQQPDASTTTMAEEKADDIIVVDDDDDDVTPDEKTAANDLPLPQPSAPQHYSKHLQNFMVTFSIVDLFCSNQHW
jgi:hypothetical protein